MAYVSSLLDLDSNGENEDSAEKIKICVSGRYLKGIVCRLHARGPGSILGMT